MLQIALSLILFVTTNNQTIFDFKKDSKMNSWYVVDDVVMGGRSAGNMALSEDGHGIFYGYVSTANNGGFSSVRYRFDPIKSSSNSKAVLKIKGDGKAYQFRIKANSNDYHSYITYFQTSGEWEEIEIPLKKLYPSFRGRVLDIPNYEAESFEEMAILIANKRNEEFKMEIDKIVLK